MNMAQETIDQRVRREIETVHAFISAWFRGDVGQSKAAFDEQLADRLTPSFVNIQPSGQVLTRADLLASLYDGHGTNPNFTISIADSTVRYRADAGRLVMATYREHQKGAKNTDPPDNVRISTVLFEMSDGDGRPTWLHIHETGVAP